MNVACLLAYTIYLACKSLLRLEFEKSSIAFETFHLFQTPSELAS